MVGRTFGAESLHKGARAILAGKHPALRDGKTAINPYAPVALGEGQEVEFPLGADCLTACIPILDAIDKQPGEHVVRRILVKRHT